MPIGANTLGLYYNEDILEKAGVDPATITDWASLNAALAEGHQGRRQGHHLRRRPRRGGHLPVPAVVLGCGREPEGRRLGRRPSQAGQLVSDWVAKGYAPKSAITDNQSASWDLFLTGKYAFAENGSWFAKAAAAEKFPIKMMPIPLGSPAAPLRCPRVVSSGSCPCTRTTALATTPRAKQVIDCLLGTDKQITTDNMLGYFTANKDHAGRSRSPRSRCRRRGRTRSTVPRDARPTSGPDYLTTSAALSKAEQAALNASGDQAKVADGLQGRRAGGEGLRPGLAVGGPRTTGSALDRPPEHLEPTEKP